MNPIIKYSGGKRREFKEFKTYIPEHFINYYEPFLGGGATFFALKPKHAYLSDINQNLIHFYQDLQQNAPLVMRELKFLQYKYSTNVAHNKIEYKKQHYVTNDKNQKMYYLLRDMFNGNIMSAYHYATLYYFINKTAYAGMMRYNKHGKFNVPFGRYLHFNLPNKKQIQLLQSAHIQCCSYQKMFHCATSRDFMFLDPPYDSTFSSYGNGAPFGTSNQIELARQFKQLKCRALMIIAKTPLIMKLYHNFIKDSYGKRYSINIKNRFKSKTYAQHLIITNY